MNPEFVKSELEKLRSQGFAEELIVSKHADGRVSVLTHLAGSKTQETVVETYLNGVDTVASVIISLCKVYSAPGQDRVLTDVFMKHLAERMKTARPSAFQMGFRPSVEPDLRMRTTDQDQPEED